MRCFPRDNLLPAAAALRCGLLIATAVLAAPVLAAPPGAATIDPAAFVQTAAGKKDAKPKPRPKAAAKAKAASAKQGGKPAKKKQKKADPEDLKPGPLADFGKVDDAPDDVVHVANWVSYTRNARKKGFVLIDKKQARLYVFDARGKLKGRTPVLLGKAVGDHTVPGVGDKPMSQVKEEEKTTPAGRFLAQPGRNTSGEDIIWIDYNASVSMHRLRKVAAEERRAERMATPEPDDNRISYGCVNVPPKFYNAILKPTVMRQGAFVYVLPETRTPQQQFASFDVPPKGQQLAQAGDAPRAGR